VLSLAFKSIFSILAILIGSSLIIWIIYIDRSPDYQRRPLAVPLGIAAVMIGVGVYWAKQVIGQLRRSKSQQFSPEDPHSSDR
jgi:hypothetical protein